MQDIKLIPARSTDIESISDLAVLIWNQHYPAIIGQKQIDYMLGKMYNKDSLLEQMLEKAQQFYFITTDSHKIGFLSVKKEREHEWFLAKFYINQHKAGKGFGEISFLELLKLTGAKKITLTVNRLNYKAINFYFKLGFRIKRVEDFDIGEGYMMNDFVMEWVLIKN